MKNFIIRWLVTAIAVGVAVWLVPGIEIIGGNEAWVGIAIFGLMLALVNISIKPLMQVLSLPITVITLGIFYLIVNTFFAVRSRMACKRHLPSWVRHCHLRQRVRGIHRDQHRVGNHELPGRSRRLERQAPASTASFDAARRSPIALCERDRFSISRKPPWTTEHFRFMMDRN